MLPWRLANTAKAGASGWLISLPSQPTVQNRRYSLLHRDWRTAEEYSTALRLLERSLSPGRPRESAGGEERRNGQ